MIPSKTTAAFHISADFKDETFKSNLQKHASCDSIKLNTYEKCPVKQTKSNIVLKTGEEHQLVSPFGKLCGHSGPFEAMILSKEDFTDDSFESTDESDINQDSNDPIGITHNHFHNIEVIWAKRPCLPWFPGIIINPNEISKEIKDLIKNLGASFPTKEQLSAKEHAISLAKQFDKLYFIFLFNRKRTWLWLPESKLRPFCEENDMLFLKNTQMLSSKFRKEVEKAYKRAKKYTKSITKTDHNNYCISDLKNGIFNFFHPHNHFNLHHTT